MVSTKAKLVFGISVFASIGTVLYVHYAQQFEKLRLQAGVQRDLERQKLKKVAKKDEPINKNMSNGY